MSKYKGIEHREEFATELSMDAHNGYEDDVMRRMIFAEDKNKLH